MRRLWCVLAVAVCLWGRSCAVGQTAAPAMAPAETPGERKVVPGSGPDERGVYYVGGHVLPPVVLKQKNPKFSKEARHNHYSGTSVIRLIVDENGMPQHVEVTKAAGEGLDEAALAAVEQYRFKPATKDGKAVPVEIRVEVNFQMM